RNRPHQSGENHIALLETHYSQSLLGSKHWCELASTETRSAPRGAEFNQRLGTTSPLPSPVAGVGETRSVERQVPREIVGRGFPFLFSRTVAVRVIRPALPVDVAAIRKYVRPFTECKHTALVVCICHFTWRSELLAPLAATCSQTLPIPGP